MPPAGRDNLRHLVVLMMENRSFDHLLGSLKAADPRIDGLTGQESNPDTTGATVNVQPLAQFKVSSIDPNHDFVP
jgi:phospholipase C